MTRPNQSHGQTRAVSVSCTIQVMGQQRDTLIRVQQKMEGNDGVFLRGGWITAFGLCPSPGGLDTVIVVAANSGESWHWW
jgi:hypothetical protein